MLIQNNRPIHFAYRSLTSSEKRYANIERELLTVVFGCKRFYHYIFGTASTVESDYKPLSIIALKHIFSIPLRLQRLLMKLQNFIITITYRPRKYMVVANSFSNLLPLGTSDNMKTEDTNKYVHYMNVTQKTEHIIRIARETNNIYTDLRKLIKEG